jgi:superfamily II DNA/RNA helicase
LVEAPHDPKAKRDTLRALIRTQDNIKNAIVFANRKTTVALLDKSLRQHGFNAGALHGDMDQSARMKTLAAFRANELTILIASDVAARGLDIPDVSHVFNFDVPTHSEDYVHRIGRTGRAGREGHAFTLVTREESKQLKGVLDLIKKDIPYFKLDNVVAEQEPAPSRARREPRREKPKREQVPQEQLQHEPRPAKQHNSTSAVEPRKIARDTTSRPPPRHKDEAVEDASSFHEGNMPAFLVKR